MIAELNLASRPFVNRLPHVLLLVTLSVVAVITTVWNVSQFLATKSEARAVENQLAVLADEEHGLDRRRQDLLQQVASADLPSLTARVGAANSVLDEKALSWTLLLDRLQQSLPWSAAVTSVQTSLKEGRVQLAVELRARGEGAYLEFLDAMETSPCFSNVYPSNDERAPTGEFTASIQAEYEPSCGTSNDSPRLKGTKPGSKPRGGPGRASRGGRRG